MTVIKALRTFQIELSFKGEMRTDLEGNFSLLLENLFSNHIGIETNNSCDAGYLKLSEKNNS